MSDSFERKKGNQLLLKIVIGLFSLFCLLPLWVVALGSITREDIIVREGYKLFTTHLSLDAYKLLFTGERVYRSFSISVIVTLAGTALSLAATSMLAYSLSNKGLKYRNQLSFIVFFTMLFSGGIVPWYILITQYLKMGNSLLALFIPYLVNPWYMFMMRNFFSAVPESIMESAKIDGANDIFILARIVLPLSLPALATIGLFYTLQYWNDWWLALMFIEDGKKYPMQMLLRALVSNLMAAAGSLNSRISVRLPSYGVRMATTIVTIGPIVFVYPAVQKYFIKGLTVGAIKG